MSFPKENIRNFFIIAHIDHGKSTLADRLLEKTSSVSERDMEEQILDSIHDADKLLICELSRKEDENGDNSIVYAYEAEIDL